MNSILKSTIAAQIGATITIAVWIVDAAAAHALAINGAASGISNPAQTIDFDDITDPDGTAITNRYSGSGVTFSGLFASSFADFDLPNLSGRDLSNFDPNNDSSTIVNPFSIQFSTPQTAASFAMITNPGTSTFTALFNGVVVETFTASTNPSSTSNFYGFTNSSGFNEIRIVAGDTGNGTIDRLQIGNAATPVPFGFTPLPGLAVSSLLCGVNRLRKRFANEHAEV